MWIQDLVQLLNMTSLRHLILRWYWQDPQDSVITRPGVIDERFHKKLTHFGPIPCPFLNFSIFGIALIPFLSAGILTPMEYCGMEWPALLFWQGYTCSGIWLLWYCPVHQSNSNAIQVVRLKLAVWWCMLLHRYGNLLELFCVFQDIWQWRKNRNCRDAPQNGPAGRSSGTPVYQG